MATRFSRRTVILLFVGLTAGVAVLCWDLALVFAGEHLAAHPLHLLAVAAASVLISAAHQSYVGDRIVSRVDGRYQQLKSGLVGLGARLPDTGAWPVVSSESAYMQGFEIGVAASQGDGHVTRLSKRRHMGDS